VPGFAEEKVDVFGHEDVAEDVELVPLPEALEGIENEGAGVVVVEIGKSVEATEGDEMIVTEGVITLEARRHGSRVNEVGFGETGCPVHGRSLSMSGVSEVHRCLVVVRTSLPLMTMKPS